MIVENSSERMIHNRQPCVFMRVHGSVVGS